MRYFFFFTVLLLFFCLIFVLYKYLYDIVKYFKLNKNKKVKYFVLVFSIIIFLLSFIFIFLNKITSIFSIFILYTIFTSLIVYILNIFLKRYNIWNKIYLFIPFILSIITVIYGLYNMQDIKLKEYNLNSYKLKNNYKAILIADLHYGVSLNDKQLKKYCEEITLLNPDFIFLAGDIVDEKTTKKQMENAFNILGSIKSKYGIFYTYGNHDKNNYSKSKKYSITKLNKSIRDNNIIILEEDKYYINNDIILIGRGYEIRKNIEEIFTEKDKNLYSILIDHIPQDYNINKNIGINLELSGHTHAGQIFPIGIIEKVYKTSDLVYGKVNNGEFTAIVTSGIAGWAIPIRTEAHSEYVLINLKSKKH